MLSDMIFKTFKPKFNPPPIPPVPSSVKFDFLILMNFLVDLKLLSNWYILTKRML